MIEPCDDISPTDELPLKPEGRLQRKTILNSISQRAHQGHSQPARYADELPAIHSTFEQTKDITITA